MEGRARDPQTAAALIAEILNVANRLRAELDAPCEQRGVSASRFAVLMVIDQSGEDGCSQTELAESLGLSESNISALVEGLRKAGFLYRFRSKRDRRRSVLLLSESGSDLLSILTEARDVAAQTLLGGLSRAQVTELRRLLSILAEHLDRDAPASALRRAS